MLFQVQFMAMTSQLNFPATSTFRNFGGGFAWMSFQLRPPLAPRFGQCGPPETDDLEVDQPERDATEEYLNAVGMSAAELFVYNLLWSRCQAAWRAGVTS